jgi:hypothetical protein
MKKTNTNNADKVLIQRIGVKKFVLFFVIFTFLVALISFASISIPRNKDGWKTYATQKETIEYYDFKLQITKVSDLKIKAPAKPVYATDPKADTRAVKIDFLVENIGKQTEQLMFNFYLTDAQGNVYKDESWGIASYLNSDTSSLLDFQPNVPQAASIVFEVPTNFNPKNLKLKMETIYTGMVFTNATVNLDNVVTSDYQ